MDNLPKISSRYSKNSYNSIGSRYAYIHRLSQFEANRPTTFNDFFGWTPNEGLLKKIVSTPLNVLSKPVMMVTGGLDYLVKGKSPLQGVMGGFTGRVNKAPTDVLQDAGVDLSKQSDFVKFATNMAAYAVLDPLAIGSKLGHSIEGKNGAKTVFNTEHSVPTDNGINVSLGQPMKDASFSEKAFEKNQNNSTPFNDKDIEKVDPELNKNEIDKGIVKDTVQSLNNSLNKGVNKVNQTHSMVKDLSSAYSTNIANKIADSSPEAKDKVSLLSTTTTGVSNFLKGKSFSSLSTLHPLTKESIKQIEKSQHTVYQNVNQLAAEGNRIVEGVTDKLWNEYKKTGKVPEGFPSDIATKQEVRDLVHSTVTYTMQREDGLHTPEYHTILSELHSKVSGFNGAFVLKVDKATIPSVKEQINVGKWINKFSSKEQNASLQQSMHNVLDIDNNPHLELAYKPFTIEDGETKKITAVKLELKEKNKQNQEALDAKIESVIGANADILEDRKLRGKSSELLKQKPRGERVALDSLKNDKIVSYLSENFFKRNEENIENDLNKSIQISRVYSKAIAKIENISSIQTELGTNLTFDNVLKDNAENSITNVENGISNLFSTTHSTIKTGLNEVKKYINSFYTFKRLDRYALSRKQIITSYKADSLIDIGIAKQEEIEATNQAIKDSYEEYLESTKPEKPLELKSDFSKEIAKLDYESELNNNALNAVKDKIEENFKGLKNIQKAKKAFREKYIVNKGDIQKEAVKLFPYKVEEEKEPTKEDEEFQSQLFSIANKKTSIDSLVKNGEEALTPRNSAFSELINKINSKEDLSNFKHFFFINPYMDDDIREFDSNVFQNLDMYKDVDDPSYIYLSTESLVKLPNNKFVKQIKDKITQNGLNSFLSELEYKQEEWKQLFSENLQSKINSFWRPINKEDSIYYTKDGETESLLKNEDSFLDFTEQIGDKANSNLSDYSEFLKSYEPLDIFTTSDFKKEPTPVELKREEYVNEQLNINKEKYTENLNSWTKLNDERKNLIAVLKEHKKTKDAMLGGTSSKLEKEYRRRIAIYQRRKVNAASVIKKKQDINTAKINQKYKKRGQNKVLGLSTKLNRNELASLTYYASKMGLNEGWIESKYNEFKSLPIEKKVDNQYSNISDLKAQMQQNSPEFSNYKSNNVQSYINNLSSQYKSLYNLLDFDGSGDAIKSYIDICDRLDINVTDARMLERATASHIDKAGQLSGLSNLLENKQELLLKKFYNDVDNPDIINEFPELRYVINAVQGIHKVGFIEPLEASGRLESYDATYMARPYYLRRLGNKEALFNKSLYEKLSRGAKAKDLPLGNGQSAKILRKWAAYPNDLINSVYDTKIFNQDPIAAQSSILGVYKKDIFVPNLFDVAIKNNHIRVMDSKEFEDYINEKEIPPNFRVINKYEIKALLNHIKTFAKEGEIEKTITNMFGDDESNVVLIDKSFHDELETKLKRSNLSTKEAKVMGELGNSFLNAFRRASLLDVGFWFKSLAGNMMNAYLERGDLSSIVANHPENMVKVTRIGNYIKKNSSRVLTDVIKNSTNGEDIMINVQKTLHDELETKFKYGNDYKKYIKLVNNGVFNQHYFKEAFHQNHQDIIDEIGKDENKELKNNIINKFGSVGSWFTKISDASLNVTMTLDNAVRLDTYNKFEKDCLDAFKNNNNSKIDSEYRDDFNAALGDKNSQQEFTDKYAAAKTKQIHFDYSDVSPKMKKLRSVFPFFVFMFKNMERRLSNIKTIYQGLWETLSTGKINANAWAMASRYNIVNYTLLKSWQSAFVPNSNDLNPYLLTGDLPIEHNGKIYSIHIGNTLDAFTSVFSSNIFGSMNPIIKTLYESLTGRNMETGKTVSSVWDDMKKNFSQPFASRLNFISQYSNIKNEGFYGLLSDPFVNFLGRGTDTSKNVAYNLAIEKGMYENYLKSKGLYHSRRRNPFAKWNYKEKYY